MIDTIPFNTLQHATKVEFWHYNDCVLSCNQLSHQPKRANKKQQTYSAEDVEVHDDDQPVDI